jgi:uncharacterized damage-inducible protein DinB
MLQNKIKNNFTEIIEVLQRLDDFSYTQPFPMLSNATIGEHTRHIIEMYQSLIHSYEIGIVNYDKRARNKTIETHRTFAIEQIEKLLATIEKPNKSLVLQQGTTEITLEIETNYERELLYNLEHSIHHQALIKVALLQLQSVEIPENFGVAQSTIVYRESQCVR